MRHSPDEKTHLKSDHMSFDPDVEMRKYVDAGEQALNTYFKGEMSRDENASFKLEEFWTN